MTVHSIRKHPDIQSLLSRLPNETAASLTDQQLKDLKLVLSSGSWRKHRVDIRTTVSIPFYPSKIYFVLLMGKNLRTLSDEEKNAAFLTSLILIGVFFSLSASIVLVTLYAIKSFLGINLFPNYSLGLWDWMKSLVE